MPCHTLKKSGACLLQGTILPSYVQSKGVARFLATFRNASCISASINSYSDLQYLPSPVTLTLINERGLEDLCNPAAASFQFASPGSFCRAGTNDTGPSCNFATSGLNPAFPYHFFLSYQGNSSASASLSDAFILMTVTSSNSGAYGSPDVFCSHARISGTPEPYSISCCKLASSQSSQSCAVHVFAAGFTEHCSRFLTLVGPCLW